MSYNLAMDWGVIIFIVVVALAFAYGGVWIGIIAIVLGIVALGWSKRHKGPFPINKSEEFNLVSKQEERLKQGLEYLRKNQEITNEQYRELVGVSQSQATRDLETLEQEGMIEQLGTSGPDVKYKLKN